MVGLNRENPSSIPPISDVEQRFEALKAWIIEHGLQDNNKALGDLEQTWYQWTISTKTFIKRLRLEEEHITSTSNEQTQWEIEKENWEKEKLEWILSKEKWEEETEVWGGSAVGSVADERKKYDRKIGGLEEEVKQLRVELREERVSNLKNFKKTSSRMQSLEQENKRLTNDLKREGDLILILEQEKATLQYKYGDACVRISSLIDDNQALGLRMGNRYAPRDRIIEEVASNMSSSEEPSQALARIDKSRKASDEYIKVDNLAITDSSNIYLSIPESQYNEAALKEEMEILDADNTRLRKWRNELAEESNSLFDDLEQIKTGVRKVAKDLMERRVSSRRSRIANILLELLVDMSKNQPPSRTGRARSYIQQHIRRRESRHQDELEERREDDPSARRRRYSQHSVKSVRTSNDRL